MKCVCVWLGAWEERGLVDERIGLGFINPVGIWGVLDVCLGCGGVCGVGGEWVGALTRVWRGGVMYV